MKTLIMIPYIFGMLIIFFMPYVYVMIGKYYDYLGLGKLTQLIFGSIAIIIAIFLITRSVFAYIGLAKEEYGEEDNDLVIDTQKKITEDDLKIYYMNFNGYDISKTDKKDIFIDQFTLSVLRKYGILE